MIMKRKSVTQRAAEAIKENASAVDLLELKREVSQRIQEVETELKAKKTDVENAMGTGDLEELRAVRQAESDLEDESMMLHRQQSELHRAIKIAQGEEAVKATSKHRKTLDKALDQAAKAQAMLEESRQMAREVIQARQYAAQIGQRITFNPDTIRALASMTYPEGNQSKQLMIELGIREAMEAA
ncbi:hypothetical protein [Marinobacter qingdaonensis]|uniref:Phage shock protein A (PspA) family protein n=1 Tax=Marinobacter qingdaonensis TaxID=3108486 RepID=A0ABU5P1M9_9GAMM|nr:hypothetical protein [Marinobacter sp. ASW11-75]MEA1081973.1 hypothetical protein [Marinobacter sp. ASW11-75]